MSVVSLADVKSAGNFQTNGDDDALQAALDAAETMIARHIGPLTPTAKVDVVRGCSTTLTLESFPVISLTSVVDVFGTTLTLSTLHLDTGSGVIRFSPPWQTFYASTYTVTYQAGWATVPGDVMQAIIELTRHLWKPRNAASNRSGGSPSDSTPMPYALPNRVQEYLTPYIPLPGV
jgi:hypothetical protein